MKQFIRIQDTEGREVIINVNNILKVTAQPKTLHNYARTMIELNVGTEVNIFTYLSTDIIFDKLN